MSRIMVIRFMLGFIPAFGMVSFASSAFAETTQPELAFQLPRSAAAFVAIIVAAVLVWRLSVKGGALRDSLLAQMRVRERSFSLGRCQMAFWFVIVFSCWIFFLLSTGNYNTLTEQAVTLVGISLGTGLATVAIDRNKDIGLQEADAKLNALGLATSADVDVLDQELETLAGVQTRTTVQEIVYATQSAKRVAYQQIIAPYATSGSLLSDLVNDIHGPTLHRFQVVVWTLGLGAAFVFSCFTHPTMPVFSNELLALMTISGGAYAGFKMPERQS